MGDPVCSAGDRSGLFSMNLLHVHGETACILHIVQDLHNTCMWHHRHILDALDSFSMESTCIYSSFFCMESAGLQ